MTGDEVPVELTAEVHYRIADLKEFLYSSAQAAGYSASGRGKRRSRDCRDDVARRHSHRRRAAAEQDCLAALHESCAITILGVDVSDFKLLDIHPPQTVVPAYRDVADALEEESQRVNEAEAYYTTRLYSAAGERAIDTLRQSLPKQEKAGTARGVVTDWKLTDELWNTLIKGENSGTGALFRRGGQNARRRRARTFRQGAIGRGSGVAVCQPAVGLSRERAADVDAALLAGDQASPFIAAVDNYRPQSGRAAASIAGRSHRIEGAGNVERRYAQQRGPRQNRAGRAERSRD